MALNFTSTGSFLKNTQNLLTTYPFSVGMWVNYTSTGSNRAFWSITDGSATPTNYFSVGLGSLGRFAAIASSTGTAQEATTTAPALGNWYYVLCLFISATSRICWTLNGSNSAITGVSNTTSTTPASLNGEYIGVLGSSTPSKSANIPIAEFWKANVNVLNSSATSGAPQHLVRELAFRGPFALPHIAGNIVDYRAFDKPLGGYDLGDAYFAGAKQPVWLPNGSPAFVQHPLLLRSDYASLSPRRLFAPI